MEDTIRYTLGKKERLYKKNHFDELLSSGNSFVSYPLRGVFFLSEREEGDVPAQMAVSVSKKRFKRAVRRNRIKRLVRESYRLNKHQLYTIIPEGKTINILFIYLQDTIGEYSEFEKAIIGGIKKIRNHIEKNFGLDIVATD